MSTLVAGIGAALDRVEGAQKVTGRARYAFEQPLERVAYAWPVGAAVGRGRVRGLDAVAVERSDGVLAVVWHANALPLQPVADPNLAVFQSADVAHRGQLVAAVVAESLEQAREGARVLSIDYASDPPDAALTPDHAKLYRPDHVNPSYETDTDQGDFDRAFAAAEVATDHTYTTPPEHNNAMEPHATTAAWEGGRLILHDSNQGPDVVRQTLAEVFGLDPGAVQVISPHVGGGFGSKGTPRPSVVLAAMCARIMGRPVKLALSRRDMFAVAGHRTPTIQRVRLGAGSDGRLVAIAHDVAEHTSTLREFAEQTALATRMIYASPNRRTTHRVAALDVPTPSWMRAPGECPGMFALESAIDELAVAAGVDPIELRARNEPQVDPESGLPFSSHGLVACLRRGAEVFGWASRDPQPGARRRGRLLVGTGVAASTYPARCMSSRATARADADGGYTVRISAVDIGQGARTVLTQIAAEALEVDPPRLRVEIGDSSYPPGRLAGGSMGTSSWGTAIVKACAQLRGELDRAGGEVPPAGIEVSADTADDLAAPPQYSRHSFGAQFAEVTVDVDTGEVRVPRMLGVFAAGRIVNPKLARSQLVGGMIMGIGMALMEEGVTDEEFGGFTNDDLAGYHVMAHADVGRIEATWIDEDDPHVNPMGAKGIGEVGIVGTAAAVANAVHHATGIRIRDLPIRLDRLLEAGLTP